MSLRLGQDGLLSMGSAASNHSGVTSPNGALFCRFCVRERE